MKQSKKNKAYAILQNSMFNHLLFWTVSYFILINIFSNANKILPVDRIYTLIFMVTLALPVYLNLQFLIPRFLRTGKYLAYSLGVIQVLSLGVAFNAILFGHLIDYILPGYYFISYYTLWDLAKFFLAFLISSTLMKLSKEWFELLKTQKEISELEKEKTAIELKALRSQVNPHFLFNTLNVLYTLALDKAEETPEVIIKLSDLLRYVIYDSNKDSIPLSAELEQINNYISLQNYRTENTAKVKLTKYIKEDIHIPPMLLIPLVENSYKHGIKGDLDNTFIDIQINADKRKLDFEIENNLPEARDIKQTDHGVGLANIQNRLALLFPEKHLFQISKDEHKFKVSLKLSHED
ncbi:sensor histidine kinase [Echinicola salinicaeni]|uniref:sensor histidine kinase n=1 Tax=Echinicola salinicaeni TaxID=2762757 RepID=UPI00164836D6|nr:histidine kinase [Echinicola salinicaeni]